MLPQIERLSTLKRDMPLRMYHAFLAEIQVKASLTYKADLLDAEGDLDQSTFLFQLYDQRIAGIKSSSDYKSIKEEIEKINHKEVTHPTKVSTEAVNEQKASTRPNIF